MKKSNTPIIKHIPDFLDYCEVEKGLADKTQKNYQQYLAKLVSWLKKTKKDGLLPHELTSEDIWAYRLYLSRYTDEKGRPLKKVTQNYYLIALRALLGYFTAKDVVSLPADKIALPKDARAERTVKFLNLEQIERLLLAPNTKTLIGLRDKAILETLISTGLRIGQLTSLNRDKLGEVPGEALLWVKKYLATRKDNNNALFINYKGKRGSIGGRLTARSIERIVNSYGKKTNLPFFITPEILRWARALALLNKEIAIKKLQTHKTFAVKNYRHTIGDDGENIQYLSPTWNNIENSIKKEITWLKNNIPVLPGTYKQNPSFLKCDDCIFRKIAILITAGKVQTIEFKAEKDKDLWNNLTKRLNINKVNRHGQEWHKKMMDVIYEYFKSQNCKAVLEPTLNYGRADLAIYSNLNNPLFIEVDTVSLFKLWYNLSTMRNVNFLIVPSENRVIEFRV